MYSIYQAGVSPEGGLEVGQTLSFWREMKINNMYITEI